jgi:hypothetical protein
MMRALLAVIVAVFLWFALSKTRVDNYSIVTTGARPAFPVPACGDSVLRDNGVGELLVGMSVDSLKEKCRVAIDTIQEGPEGMPERRLFVAFPPELLQAEVIDGKVWRIDVESPRFRTNEGLGVGSKLSELLKLRNARGMVGEARVFLVSPDHCGLSFQLSHAPDGSVSLWDKKALEALPGHTVRVERVLVVAGAPQCQPQP